MHPRPLCPALLQMKEEDSPDHDGPHGGPIPRANGEGHDGLGGHHALKFGRDFRLLRARADDGNVSHQHVEELREFVEPGGA